MDFKHRTLGFDKIYVINLKRRQDRKEQIIKDFPNTDFTFIEAIDGKNLSHHQLIEQGKLNTSFFDPNGMITNGVFACALSHKKAWDQALMDGVENALFLEDDVYPICEFVKDQNYIPEYQQILDEIKQYDWDLIHLGKKTEFQFGINIGNFLTMPRFNANYHGAHAYIVKKETIKYLSDNYLPIKYAADVYLEQLYNTHNSFTLKQSIIRQKSDTLDTQNADSDTYYNDFRESGGNIGISFNDQGNVINKKIAQYLKHPEDLLNQYMEIVFTKPKFGIQKFNKNNFFGLSEMLKYLSNNLPLNTKMVELYSHLGESTFYFGCSELFSNIYAIDPLKGKDTFNIKNNISWKDVEIGFHSNTFHFDNISKIKEDPIKVSKDFSNISFLYINNRKQEDIHSLILSYLPIINENGFIGGDNTQQAPPNSIIFNNNWIIKKKDYLR